jgi:FMN-dependent NADH-azoreductase
MALEEESSKRAQAAERDERKVAMNILHICANPKPTEDSVSKQLAIAFFSKLVELNPDIDIVNVDLYQEPPPYLSYEAIRGLYYPVYIKGYSATKAEKKAMAYGENEAKKFNAADILVLTMPMWNFSVPAIMKAWMDQIVTPGNTFTIDQEQGITPLHHVKKLIMLVSSGGQYKEGDDRDALTNQVERLFGWIGIDDVGIAWSEGQDSFLFSDAEAHRKVAVEAAQELAEEVADLAKAPA